LLIVKIPAGRRLYAGLRAVAVSMVLIVLMSGCTASAHAPVARLATPIKDEFVETLLVTRANQPYTLSSLLVCLDRPGSVRLLHVYPVNAVGGLRVDAFVAVPNPFELGQSPGEMWTASTIRDAPQHGDNIDFPKATTIANHVCPPITVRPTITTQPKQLMLFIEFSKPTEAHAEADQVAIEYESGGKKFDLIVPFGIALCAAGDQSKRCSG
jgi:hypothetical protein